MALPPFQRLLDAHAGDVLRFLVGAVGRDDADDAFQETLLSALRAYPGLQHADNLRAWLFTIAHRKATDVHRARARRPVPVGAVEDRAGGVGPEDDAGSDWELVRALPPRQRAVLTLRYAADLTHRDIAAVLGCSEDASRRAAADGLKALRKELVP
jgi:RNA polymerase sigma factor (sigma-70 family)